MKITAFLPVKKNSVRVPNKNTSKIGIFKLGLFEIKINQLLKINYFSNIIVSTNDQEIIEYLNFFNNRKIILDIRPETLCKSSTSTDDLIKYVIENFNFEHLFWTHVTSPFFNSSKMSKVLQQYNKIINLKEGFDTIAGVCSLKSYIVNDKFDCINKKSHDYQKWPNTQDLEEFFEINNSFFLTSRISMIKTQDRIGNKVFPYVMDKLSSFDIDWPDEFSFAKTLISRNIINLD